MGGSSSGGAAGGRDPSGGTGGMSSVGMLGPGMGSAGATGAADAATTDAAEGDGPGEDAGDADPGGESDAADAEPTSQPDTGPPPPSCGDGKLDPGEKCDQGDRNDKDAYGMGKCTDTCSDAPACGDQRIDTAHGEKCDRGSQNAANAYGPEACDDKCQPAPFCGDNTRQSGREECDEGARNTDNPPRYDQRACTKACKVVHPRCGDSITQAPNEECDDGNRNVGGSYGTRGQCTRACKRVDFCGDAKVTMPQEQCEPPNTPASAGKEGCDGRCRTIPPLPECGNGKIEMDEQCDNGRGATGNLPGTTSYSATATRRSDGKDVCNSACKIVHFCGDRRHDAIDRANMEECDNGPANSDTSACTTKCKRARCGDGFKQGGETCDDGDDNGKPGKCKADCSGQDPGRLPVVILPNKVEAGGRSCSGPCLTDVRDPGGTGVKIACLPAAGMDLAPGELGNPTVIEFPKTTSLVDGRITLDLSDGRPKVECFVDPNQLMPVGSGGAVPAACMSASGPVRIQISNEDRSSPGTSCITLHQARLDAVSTQ